MKYLSLGLFILVVNGGTFAQLEHVEERWSDLQVFA